MIAKLAHASPRRRLAGWLLCAMLLMQGLGLWHGIVHAQGPHEAAHAAHTDAAAQPEPTGGARLFAHHGDVSDCQVFDQLSHADAPGLAPRLHADAEYADHGRLCAPPLPDLAARASGFEARGPPTPV